MGNSFTPFYFRLINLNRQMYQKLSQMIGGNIDNALSQNCNRITQIKIL